MWIHFFDQWGYLYNNSLYSISKKMEDRQPSQIGEAASFTTFFSVRRTKTPICGDCGKDDKPSDDGTMISIDASRFERNAANSGLDSSLMIMKCFRSMVKIPNVTVFNVLPQGQTYFDRFVQHYDQQSDKSNIGIRLRCCTKEGCCLVLFHQILANNGELTERHKQLAMQSESGTM